MSTKQGDLALLDDPVARELLQATSPAKLGYTWTDGTPRVVPIGFHWDGHEVVLGTPVHAPKMRALAAHPKVALTIDTAEYPYKVLMIRGTATFRVMNEIVPEYALMTHRCLGPGAEAWLQQVGAMLPAMGGMARVAIAPEWVGILDFQQRFPSAIELALQGAAESA
jgi:nitroimidazol reductase NimA-like FMN-containing flavoprotein (pyridoxamine 5'-phosphate oxidase superfamily)